MSVKVGDLAIAKFYSAKKVCLVTEIEGSRVYFIYWQKVSKRTVIHTGYLSRNKMTKVKPMNNPWSGELSSLTIDNVTTQENTTTKEKTIFKYLNKAIAFLTRKENEKAKN